MPIFGIWKDSKRPQSSLDSEIFEILSKNFTHNKVANSPDWAFYILINELNWINIRNGIFNDQILDYTAQIKHALENAGIGKITDLEESNSRPEFSRL